MIWGRLVPSGRATGLQNYREYFRTPALRLSIWHSLIIATHHRDHGQPAFASPMPTARRLRGQGAFKTIAMVPILVPSLLPGIGPSICSASRA